MMMKKSKVDFVIRYEHKVREIESVVLLKLELERRGYSVAFHCDFEDTPLQYDPIVYVGASIYSDSTFDVFEHCGIKKKVANLLWEQLIGTEEENNPQGYHNVTQTARKLVSFCWGEKSRERIVKFGVPSKNAILTGKIDTDLLRGDFKRTLRKKEDLGTQYGLDSSKKWYLFVSSFAYCDLDEAAITYIKQISGEDEFNSFYNVSVKSRTLLFDWLKTVLEKHPEVIWIYRPHPSEVGKSALLKEMQESYSNFKVETELALKQWINASDKIYNWYSTGIIDAIVLGKPIRMLRPCKINEGRDYAFYKDCKQIQTKETFEEDYPDNSKQPVLDVDLFSEYFYLPDGFVYEKICDTLEEIYKSDKYDIKLSLTESIKWNFKLLKCKLSGLYDIINRLFPFVPLFQRRMEFKKQMKAHRADGYARNVATPEEIQEIEDKLRPIVNRDNCID